MDFIFRIESQIILFLWLKMNPLISPRTFGISKGMGVFILAQTRKNNIVSLSDIVLRLSTNTVEKTNII